jgi:membrane protease YdiL (CAAX protease family)
MTNPTISKKRSPLKFFLVVFALSIPIWLTGFLTPLQLAPGLPLSSLMLFCPVVAASILVYRENRMAGVTGLLKRSFDHRRIESKVWYLHAVLLMPFIAVLAYGFMRLVRMPLPTPEFPVLGALFLFAASFVAALCEELGWMGYVFEPMQDRWNAIQAGIALGSIGALWHIIPFVQADRSPAWIAWQCFNLVAIRILLVWLYNNTGKSVFAVALCHAMVNVSWQLFPNNGSHYDPRITGLITAFAAIMVTVKWGPKTLARYRNS